MGQARQRREANQMPYQQPGYVEKSVEPAFGYVRGSMPEFDPGSIWDLGGCSATEKEFKSLVLTPDRQRLIGFHVTDEKHVPEILKNGLKPFKCYVGFARQERAPAIWLQMGYPVLPHCYDDYLPHVEKPVIFAVETTLSYAQGKRRFQVEGTWQGVQLAVQENEIVKITQIEPEHVKKFRSLDKRFMADGLDSEKGDTNGFWHRLARSVS